ncbi:MAG TPA: hypothetical protein VN711_00200 [Candidatus Saccharimonadales bacterium]|nr:hypothetical protein [Candidatus Saccharimonadales bacterium]
MAINTREVVSQIVRAVTGQEAHDRAVAEYKARSGRASRNRFGSQSLTTGSWADAPFFSGDSGK